VVLVHGLTNCPEQFAAFGERLYSDGDNVVLVRLPEHGARDRRGRGLARLTPESVARRIDLAIDIAHGLGEHVVVVGLSVGAVGALWAALERPDVERGVVVAPLLGMGGMPAPVSRALTRLWLALPDMFLWWDFKLRQALPGPTQTYWGWSTRGVGQMLRYAEALEDTLARRGGGSAQLVVVLNANDTAIDNRAARAVAERWGTGRQGAALVFEFPASLRLGHDLIDPGQPYARVDTVYAVLGRLVRGGRP
jgi:carboxylesterase